MCFNTSSLCVSQRGAYPTTLPMTLILSINAEALSPQRIMFFSVIISRIPVRIAAWLVFDHVADHSFLVHFFCGHAQVLPTPTDYLIFLSEKALRQVCA